MVTPKATSRSIAGMLQRQRPRRSSTSHRLVVPHQTPLANNLAQFHLARDANQIVNAWKWNPSNSRSRSLSFWHHSFSPKPATSFRRAASSSSHHRSLPQLRPPRGGSIRWYGADECGDGHYDATNGEWCDQASRSLTCISQYQGQYQILRHALPARIADRNRYRQRGTAAPCNPRDTRRNLLRRPLRAIRSE